MMSDCGTIAVHVSKALLYDAKSDPVLRSRLTTLLVDEFKYTLSKTIDSLPDLEK